MSDPILEVIGLTAAQVIAGGASSTPGQMFEDSEGNVWIKASSSMKMLSGTGYGRVESLLVPVIGNAVALTVATIHTFRFPFAIELTEVPIVNVVTAGVGTDLITIDIDVTGATLFDTGDDGVLITLDATETTSATAATAGVLTTTTIAKNALVEIKCTQVGDSTAGSGCSIIFTGIRK